MMRWQARAVFLTACCGVCCSGATPLEVIGAPARTITVTVGRELRIRLQTIGPGEYRSPPAITGVALEFRDVSQATPAVPAGPTQVFRFAAVTRGQAVVRFTHTGQTPEVVDTVVVR